jgi:hypothetical protein
MKIRNGFVSNSSSSSFVVALSVLTEKEQRKIMDYEKVSNEGSDNDFRDSWDIHVDQTRGVIHGFTSMDNGDLSKYLGDKLSEKFIFNGGDIGV